MYVNTHIQHYSKLRKNVSVTQSQNVPLSYLSRPLADRLAEAAYRDILGLSYALTFAAAWSTARLWQIYVCAARTYTNKPAKR